MARGIVQQRPFVREKRSSSSFSLSKVVGQNTKLQVGKNGFYKIFFQKYLLWIVGAMLLILLGIFLLKGTWYNPNYLIKDIEYSPETRAEYENTELFVLTSKYLRDAYLNTIQVNKSQLLLKNIRQEYPFVRDIQLNYLSPQKIKVDFVFTQPKLRVKIADQLFGVWDGGYSTPLKTGWTLSQTGFLIDTPGYLSETKTMSGFFYEVPFSRYESNLPKIQQTFPSMTRFVYLAGSPNFIVFENGKMIYLHRDNLDLQIQKYHWLQEGFSNFSGVYEIDLGSFIQDKLIIKE